MLPAGESARPAGGRGPWSEAETVAYDFLIVGSGLAGMYAALQAAHHGRCLLLTKTTLEVSNSAWAQGGIAAALDAGDDPALHVGDTLRAGRGLCRPSAVEILAREGTLRVEEMLAAGVPFDADDSGRPVLGLEGGHGRRRIVHANGGATGLALVRALLPRVAVEPNITVWEGARLAALLTEAPARDGGPARGSGPRCAGALVEREGAWVRVLARASILATGGACGLYARTTNPPTTTGDGIGMAYRAGAAVADMEFVQFHPTAYIRGQPAFLVSEAVRGEGGQLWSSAGERFMARYDPAAELAPRDVVARAVLAEMQRTGADHVDLRLDAIPPQARTRFAGLLQRLEAAGYDPSSGGIPVAPAAHFLMGGVVVDLHGRTTTPGLYACGEVACTGVHGANRLASNSLLECLVFGHRAAQAAADSPVGLAEPAPAAPIAHLDAPARRRLGEWMFADAGIVRDRAGLLRIQGQLAGLPPSSERDVAELIVAGALARTESRGAHFRADFPAEDAGLARHFVSSRGRAPEGQAWR